jgi:tetratricopeptide (TPR) repeat protein
MQRGHELKATGRLDEAIGLYEQAVALSPESGVAEHNLGGALGDAGRWPEAESHIRKAFRKGLDAPETWLVLARCLQALNRLDEADKAFCAALTRRPAMYDAHRELAQLRWMTTADVGAALAGLDAAIRAAPTDTRLAVIRAQALEYVGEREKSLAILSALSEGNPRDAYLATTASQAATALDRTGLALALAERAMQLSPNEFVPQTALIEACLGIGDAGRADGLAGALCRQAPFNQHAIALQATAWRLLGDERHRQLFDYATLVYVAEIVAPAGWANLQAYLADLSAALKAVHFFRTHPFNQSIRHGSQAVNILQGDDPALRALPEALHPAIQQFVDKLGSGSDPVRSRNLGGYAFNGMWSVRLTAGGHHVNHVHPLGWLSSACYVETVSGEGREGWIQFGEPGTRTTPPLEAEHFVKPEPGRLVLFPSYMWHGTRSFTGDQTRLTFAFDLAPADSQS